MTVADCSRRQIWVWRRCARWADQVREVTVWGGLSRLVVGCFQALAEDEGIAFLRPRRGDELSLAEERGREADGVDDGAAVARAEEAAAIAHHHGGVNRAAANACEPHEGEGLLVVLRERSGCGQRTGELGVLEKCGEARMVGGEADGEGGELTVLFADGEVMDGKPVSGHGAAHKLVLTARDFGDHFAIGMDEVQHGVQVAAYGIEQGGTVELGGEHGEGAVADGVVGHGAALDELSIVIDIDALGEPLLDAAEVRGVGKDGVHLGEGGGDHPAVIGRVNAAGGQGGRGFDEEWAQGAEHFAGAGCLAVHLGDGGGGGHVWTTKPVSGGELKFVESRSMLPSGLWERSRKPAARRIRSTSSRSP